jgi:ribonucleotide reductase beta subunit family protein with ferritin-like domain
MLSSFVFSSSFNCHKVVPQSSDMSLQTCRGKTNFFEKRVGEYQKAGVMANINKESTDTHRFSLEEDF